MSDKKSARLERFSKRCDECGGLGTLTRHYGGGFYDSTIDCDRCGGTGEVGNCEQCSGTGLVKDNEGEHSCPACLGFGAIGDCEHCGGLGVVGPERDDECPHCNGYGYDMEE